jgi:hypothetical protein
MPNDLSAAPSASTRVIQATDVYGALTPVNDDPASSVFPPPAGDHVEHRFTVRGIPELARAAIGEPGIDAPIRVVSGDVADRHPVGARFAVAGQQGLAVASGADSHREVATGEHRLEERRARIECRIECAGARRG